PDAAVGVGEERGRVAVVARHSARLAEVLGAVGFEDVRALPGAGPEAAVAVLAEEVDARVLQAVGGVDVLDRAQALRGRTEAGEADGFAVRDADVARAPLEQICRAIVAQPVGTVQPAPLVILVADGEAQLAGRPDASRPVLDHLAEPLLRAAARDRDRHEHASLELEDPAAVSADHELSAAGGEQRKDLSRAD